MAEPELVKSRVTGAKVGSRGRKEIGSRERLSVLGSREQPVFTIFHPRRVLNERWFLRQWEVHPLEVHVRGGTEDLQGHPNSGLPGTTVELIITWTKTNKKNGQNKGTKGQTQRTLVEGLFDEQEKSLRRRSPRSDSDQSHYRIPHSPTHLPLHSPTQDRGLGD